MAISVSRKKGAGGGGGEISQQRYNLILLNNNSVNNLLKVRNDDDVLKTSRNFNLRSCNIRYCRLNFGVNLVFLLVAATWKKTKQ